MAKKQVKTSETDQQIEALIEDAEAQGLPRPVVEEIIEDAVAEGVDPEKLPEVIEEAVEIEREDRDIEAPRH